MASVDLLNDILLEVLNCACTILESGICDDPTTASICGCPCRTFISAGPPVADLEACCSDGQLAVYVDRIYAFGNFPSQAAGFSPCSVPLAADIVVQLLRCVPCTRVHIYTSLPIFSYPLFTSSLVNSP